MNNAKSDSMIHGLGIEYNGKYIPLEKVRFSYKTDKEFHNHIKEIYKEIYVK